MQGYKPRSQGAGLTGLCWWFARGDKLGGRRSRGAKFCRPGLIVIRDRWGQGCLRHCAWLGWVGMYGSGFSLGGSALTVGCRLLRLVYLEVLGGKVPRPKTLASDM